MVEVGLVDVEVHHAGVRAADLRKVGVAQAAAHLGGTAPVLDLGLDLGVAALDDAGDDGVALAGALEVGHHLAHGAARIGDAEPLGGACGVEVEAAHLLEVHEDDGHVEVADGGEHVVAGGVGEQLAEDDVDVGGAELVARGGSGLLGGADAAVDDLDGVGQGGDEVGILLLELGNELRELGQVRAEGDGEDGCLCLGLYEHGGVLSKDFHQLVEYPLTDEMGRRISRRTSR